jgi:hypothetical protein
VKVLDFLIADYDQETKSWFTALIPGQPLSGTITGKGNPQLNADMSPVQVKDGIDVNVYKVSIAIAAHQVYTLKLASSSTKTVAKAWGLV